jgi:putative endonuclease
MSEITTSRAQQFGRWGETQAAAYLQLSGYTIVTRNWRTKFGEIDIIATRNQTLYFFEVKSRNGKFYGRPAQAITWKKRRNLINTAQYFMRRPGKFCEYNIKFGVIEYRAGKFYLIENIFL